MILQSPTRQLILRNEDKTGNGWFGASRGYRLHKGVDVVTFPGEEIFACMSGKVTRLGYVYKGSRKMRFVEIEKKTGFHHYKLWQMYVDPSIKKGDVVEANQLIGYAQDVAGYHNSKKMKKHVHIQLWKNGLLTDPEPLFVKELEVF